MRAASVAERPVGEERLLIPIRGDVSEPVQVMSINAVGSVVWDALIEPMGLDQLAERIVAEFEVSAEQARGDARAFVDDLCRLGLARREAA